VEAASVQRLPKIDVGTAAAMIAAMIGIHLMSQFLRSFFMGSLVVYSRWFAPERFSTLTGMQLGMSRLGLLAAAAPLAYGTATIGWRATFLVFGAVGVVLGIAMYAVVRDNQPGRGRPPQPETLADSMRGLVRVARTPGLVPVFTMQFFSYSSIVTVLGLWAGPYLSHVYGYNIEERGNFLFLLALVYVIATVCWGPADRLFKSYKRPAIARSQPRRCSLGLRSSVGPIRRR
jgi:predicted MFS family arabinose efflux permease